MRLQLRWEWLFSCVLMRKIVSVCLPEEDVHLVYLQFAADDFNDFNYVYKYLLSLLFQCFPSSTSNSHLLGLGLGLGQFNELERYCMVIFYIYICFVAKGNVRPS